MLELEVSKRYTSLYLLLVITAATKRKSLTQMLLRTFSRWQMISKLKRVRNS